MALALNQKQLELLRRICRERHPISSDQLDGRILRALLARGLVTIRRQEVGPTAAGRAILDDPSGVSQRQPRRMSRGQASPGRAAAILRAVEQLEQAIPPEAEVRVGIIQAAADDVLAGLRKRAGLTGRRL